MIADSLRPLAVALDRLAELPGNPRRGDVEAVARSYEKFGQRKPIVARVTGGTKAQPTGVVLAGNHQLKAARLLGWEEIAVTWVHDDDATAAAYALADNHTADLGDYDDRELAALIEQVRATDLDLLAATSYTEDDLHLLLAALAERPEPQAPEDFKSYDEDIETNHTCPRCGYVWSGPVEGAPL